jgi:hypothetical protein
MTDYINEYTKMANKAKNECDFNNNYDSNQFCNKFLLKKEYVEGQQAPDTNETYPTLNDPNFSLKIAKKHEFNDTQYDGEIYNIEERSNILSNMSFELSPHQLFVKNFLSSQTPYNSLLLFHGLGTGKTCSAIGITEEHRDYIKQTNNEKKIIIIASPTVQENFRIQMFNEQTMKIVNGQWKMNTCIGNKLINEVNPTHTKNIPKDKMVSKINKIINNSYEFMGYREFANYIEKKQIANVDLKKWSVKDQLARMKRNLKLEFDNRLICIDEVHNIRKSDSSENKRISSQIDFLIKNVSNMRLLFLSGTPMFNNYKEIIWLLNIMNINDGRGTMNISDIFDSAGNFRKKTDNYEGGKELFMRKATGYVSFVRGENPYTFPYRVYPDMFDNSHTFNEQPAPTKNIVGGDVVKNEVDTITKSNIYVTEISDYQNKVYNTIMKSYSNENATDIQKDLNNDSKLSYTKLQEPIQCLNITFPLQLSSNSENDINEDESEILDNVLLRGTINISDTLGTTGLKNVMNYVDERTSDMMKKGDFEYKSWVQNSSHANMFSIDNIGKYSSKMKNICESIKSSKGVILVYSQYLDSGLIPMALALEEMGYTRYGSRTKSLFKKPPTKSIGKYVMITGDRRLSANNTEEILAVTKDENKNGDSIKIVLVSQAGSEGVDLKFIRQVHILEPWYNISRLEQIIGRAVRNNSHKLLKFEDRNVQIFMYGTKMLNEERESADISIYRSAEYKAIQIGKVTRALKEISVDCFLNHEQVNFSSDNINQNVKQRLSNGDVIDNYKVGDRSYTMMTDFMEDGEYKCYNTLDITNIKDVAVNNSTYDEKFIMLNTDKIIHKIKDLFKQKFFYIKDDLFARINYPKQYPVTQIYSALTLLIDNENDYLQDMYGRNGRLVNIGQYYLFQPVELMNPQISLFERSTPMQYKNESVKIKMEIPSVLQEQITKVNTITNNSEKTNENAKNIILDMYKMYNIAIKVYNGPSKIILNKDNLYIHVGNVMKKLKEHIIFDSKNTVFDTPDDMLQSILISHLVDHLDVSNKLSVFNSIYNSNDITYDTQEEESFFNLVKKYFYDKQMNIVNSIGNTFKCIIFYDPKIKSKENKSIQYVKYENKDWILAEEEDKKDINTYIANNVRNIHNDNISKIFGFMGYGNSSTSNISFKLKDNTNSRSTGYKCSEVANRSKKVKLLYEIVMLGKNDPTIEMSAIEDEVNKLSSSSDKSFGMKEVCLFVEFITRYYHIIKKNNKNWFFDYETQNMVQDIIKVI